MSALFRGTWGRTETSLCPFCLLVPTEGSLGSRGPPTTDPHPGLSLAGGGAGSGLLMGQKAVGGVGSQRHSLKTPVARCPPPHPAGTELSRNKFLRELRGGRWARMATLGLLGRAGPWLSL